MEYVSLNAKYLFPITDDSFTNTQNKYLYVNQDDELKDHEENLLLTLTHDVTLYSLMENEFVFLTSDNQLKLYKKDSGSNTYTSTSHQLDLATTVNDLHLFQYNDTLPMSIVYTDQTGKLVILDDQFQTLQEYELGTI